MLKHCSMLVAPSLVFVAQAHANDGGRQKEFQFRLSGAQEDPTVITSARGNATLRIVGNTIAYNVRYRDLASDIQQAHIHIGADDTTGAIAVFLCTNLGNGPTGTPACGPPRSGQITGVIEAADVLDDPKLLAQGISAGDIAGLIRAIRTGLAYVNIHTVLSPAGEIRGDVAHHEHEN